MRADLGVGQSENYFLDLFRLSIVIWPHATYFSIETVCARWRILAYITIILSMDMAMPKRWVTFSVGCTSNGSLWLLLSFLFVKLTCKFHVVCLPRAACQWSGQRLRFSMGILQTSPAKVTCMYFCISNYKLVPFFLFFYSERVIFPREKAFGFQFLEWHAVCKNWLRMTQPEPSICDLKT